MPVRIYALAKELNFDSKDLVDVVKKVGIANKESPLASLSDEEEQRVREHVVGAGQAEEPVARPSPTLAAVRESVLPERKPKAIKVGRPAGARKTAKPEKEPTRPSAHPRPTPSCPGSTAGRGGCCASSRGSFADRQTWRRASQSDAQPWVMILSRSHRFGAMPVPRTKFVHWTMPAVRNDPPQVTAANRSVANRASTSRWRLCLMLLHHAGTDRWR